MDTKNRFHTKETWFWTRAEYLAIMLALSVLVALHARDVRWGRFIFAFVIIDLIGYIPGAIAYRRKSGGTISPIASAALTASMPPRATAEISDIRVWTMPGART